MCLTAFDFKMFHQKGECCKVQLCVSLSVALLEKEGLFVCFKAAFKDKKDYFGNHYLPFLIL